MKVFQINAVSDYGSTGRTVIEICNVLEEQGFDMYVAHGHLKSSHPNGFKIGSYFENKCHNILSRITGLQGYFSKRGTEKLIDYIKQVNPDIIHLRTLHIYYLNYQMLFEFLSVYNKPVVWTLHDCWSYTGRCAYYTINNCYKWQDKCQSPCPELKRSSPSLFFDKTEKMYTDKKKLFTSLNKLQIVTVSKWLKNEVGNSFLSKYPIKSIYNWIDHDVFKPLKEVNGLFEKWGVDKIKKNIISVSAVWNEQKIENALRYNELLDDDYQLILVGKSIKGEIIPNDIVHISYVNNTNDLCELYNIADLYLHFSLEDTFGKVIAEAMSCGTPVIGFDSTAIPEIIGEQGVCGYSVKPFDFEECVMKTVNICNKGKDFYTKNCRERVLENFDMVANINQYKSLYYNMVK